MILKPTFNVIKLSNSPCSLQDLFFLSLAFQERGYHTTFSFKGFLLCCSLFFVFRINRLAKQKQTKKNLFKIILLIPICDLYLVSFLKLNKKTLLGISNSLFWFPLFLSFFVSMQLWHGIRALQRRRHGNCTLFSLLSLKKKNTSFKTTRQTILNKIINKTLHLFFPPFLLTHTVITIRNTTE